VHIPGKAPYETDCAICATGIRQGQTVNVAVSPHNKHRVTIDVGQDDKDGSRRPRPVADDLTVGQGFPASAMNFSVAQSQQTVSETERLAQLAQLGQLHRQGVLTDSEFEAQKAEVLGQ